eukprot:UC4_evm2s1514
MEVPKSFPILKPPVSTIPNTKSLEHLGGQDLRAGFSSVQNDLRHDHPVQAIQENHGVHEEHLRMKILADTQGAAVVSKLKAERKLLSHFHRLGNMNSSFLGLEIILGKDDTLEFEDVLNDPCDSTFEVDVNDIICSTTAWVFSKIPEIEINSGNSFM